MPFARGVCYGSDVANLSHIKIKWGSFEMTANAGTVDANRHYVIPALHSALSDRAGGECIHGKTKMVLTAECPTNEYVAVYGRLRSDTANKPTQSIAGQDVIMTVYKQNGHCEFKKA